MNHSILEKLKGVRVKDLAGLFLFLLAILPAKILKSRRPHLWLLCEYGPEARDNAYWLFAYLRKEQPQVDAVYAIDKDSPDLERVKPLGEVVRYGSLKHWIYYLAAEANISSQKGGKPNAAVCYLLEVVTGLLKNRRIFLQHGVIMNDLPYLHYDKAKLSMFMTSTRPEYAFINGTFGYPQGTVVLTGLARYDGLYDTSDGTTIAVMPTWREWLYVPDGMRRTEGTEDFTKTLFYRIWSELLARLLDLAEKYGKRVALCLHRNMQQYNSYFQALDPRLTIVDLETGDVQNVLREAALLVSDYSSVAIDFAFLRKPLCYYQADRDQFRERHLPTGYFDYEKDGFGPVFTKADEVLAWVEDRMNEGISMEDLYTARADAFFAFGPGGYCERNYLAIIGKQKGTDYGQNG